MTPTAAMTPVRSRRRSGRPPARAIVAAALLMAATIAAQTPPPATAPTSAPTTKTATNPSAAAGGDWFAGLNKGYAADDQSDAAVFARLYPELAATDRALRDVTPRTIFNALQSQDQPPTLRLAAMYVTGNVFTDASTRAYQASEPRDPWVLVPDERKARVAMLEAKRRNAALCLDIEWLPLDARRASDEEIDRSIRTIARIAGWARAQDPTVRLLLYSMFPAGDAYIGPSVYVDATTRPAGDKYAWYLSRRDEIARARVAWRQANARLGREPADGERAGRTVALAELFDGVCPELYLYPGVNVPDPVRSVEAFAHETLDAARRYGKPIYPFVSPVLAGDSEFIDLRLWAALLRAINRHGDGAILWEGWPASWNVRTAIRVRVAMLMAERRGEMTDLELYDALKAEFPNDPDLPNLRDGTPPDPRGGGAPRHTRR